MGIVAADIELEFSALAGVILLLSIKLAAPSLNAAPR